MATTNITTAAEFDSKRETLLLHLNAAAIGINVLGNASGREDNTQALREAWAQVMNAIATVDSLTIQQ